MKRTASARWRGDLKQGTGSLTTQSGTLKDTAYSFAARFESGTGTNPEELIAAAHAGCFTMALVSRFRSSQVLAAHSCANFGIKGTLASICF